jgi:hypothetical protein
VGGAVTAVRYRVDINTLEHRPAERLGFNEIGAVLVETKRPLFFDPYEENRATGAFVLIDPLTNETLAAGMITGRVAGESAWAKELPDTAEFEASRVTPAERFIRTGHQAVTVWLAGSQDMAYALERKLFDRGCLVHVVPGENVVSVAKASTDAGLISICLPGDENAEAHDAVKRAVGSDRFVAFGADSLSQDAENAADEICRTLEERGLIRRQPKPFTGGAGI